MISPLPHAFKLQMVHNRKGQQERDTESHISEVAYVALKYQADTIEFKRFKNMQERAVRAGSMVAMRIQIGYDIVIRQNQPNPTVLMLHTRPDIALALIKPDDINIDPEVATAEYVDVFGNRCVRLMAPAGLLRLSTLTEVEDNGQPDPVYPNARQLPIEELPAECLQFLLPSRYCEVDLLTGFAWERFGHTPPGWERAQAISDFVHRHVTFGYAYARPTKTAVDVLNEGNGVCRDYQHLAITLTRALGIPTRYATGYLGDIRVTPVPGEMDFSAWYQVYLNGQWHDFDARFNTPRIGRTLQAVGRDAADVALITTFGAHTLEKFKVICHEIVD
jgi:transglutaminase-like putative cysteine protease